MRVCTIIGARPQFVKAAMVSRALARVGFEEILIHTGQHYDAKMDRVFFDEMGIPAPAVNLGVGSASHAVQTAGMMVGLEHYLRSNPAPDVVMVYGDTNSTLAAAITSAKLNLPLAHVEAGLRSFNKRMPEEINRIVTDRLSRWLFCPTDAAVNLLRAEGITAGVFTTGDVMLEATCFFAKQAAEKYPLASLTDNAEDGYYLATIHRAENTENSDRLASIIDGFGRLDAPVLLPLHPRTLKCIEGLPVPTSLQIMKPVGYLSMLTLIKGARKILTDSGGLQKEAAWLGTPCVTMRQETEWMETLAGGWNRLVGADPEAMLAAINRTPSGPPPAFGVFDGRPASDLIIEALRLS